jgi:hypothetical protein
MPSEFWMFVVNVLANWQTLLTGGFIAATIFLVEHKMNRNVPWKVIGYVLGGALFLSCFLAWHDEHHNAEVLKVEKYNLTSQRNSLQVKVDDKQQEVDHLRDELANRPPHVVVTTDQPKQHAHIQFKPFELTSSAAYPFRPSTPLSFNVFCLNAGSFAIYGTSNIQREIYLLKPPTTAEQMVQGFKNNAHFSMTDDMLNPGTVAGQKAEWNTAYGPSLSAEDIENLKTGIYKLCVIAAIRWKDETGLYETGQCGCINAEENPTVLVWADCPFNTEIKVH